MAEPSSGARQRTGTAETVLRHRVTSEYLVMSNATARDERLSYRARGLLLDMVSRPRNWRFSSERLAAASPREGRDAVRTALRELEAAGYLSRTRERLPSGQVRTVVTVSDRPVPEWQVSAAQDAAVTRREVFPQVAPETDQPTSVDPSSIEVRREEIHSDVDLTCVRSLAPLARADTPDSENDDEPRFNADWRAEDRALFAEVLDASVIETDGYTWAEGRYQINGLYNGLRKVQRKKWPGRYVARIAEDSGGIEDWLIDQGITVIK